MSEYAYNNKSKPFSKWDFLLAAIAAVVLLALLLVLFLPRDVATTANVYVNGRLVATMDLKSEYNRVNEYNGVIVRTADGALQTVYQGRTATLRSSGGRIVYPTMGVVVELI